MPPKDTNLSELSGMPAGPNIITSKKQRLQAGVSSYEYADAYNQAAMAQYNNAYNYWLWRQQAEYNSPSNQVARLKEAGLNPNFNSIEGTGNLGSIPSSSGAIAPSIGRNHAAAVGNILSGANALIGALGQGVDSMSKLADLPPLASIPEYRRTLLGIAKQTLKGKEFDNFEKTINGIFNFVEKGGEFGATPINLPYFTFNGDTRSTDFNVFDPQNSVRIKTLQQKLDNLGIDYDIKQLVKDCKQYYNDHMQELEKQILEGKSGMAVAGQVIKQIASGNTKDLSFSQVLMAVMVVALSR